MANINVGDIVHLKSDPQVLFTVINNIESEFNGKFGYGMFRIVSFDKLKNNQIVELEVHKDALIVVEE